MNARRLSTLIVFASCTLASAGAVPAQVPGVVPGGSGGQVAQPRPGMPQPRDRRTQPEKTGTASLSGRVTAADSGLPIRRVQVRVGGQELRSGRTLMTDADGRFAVLDLPAGRYTLFFNKAGFASTQYGQKQPNQPGQPIDLAEGQKLGNVNASLVRGGVIAGRVFDDFGEPIVDARVSVLQYRWSDGRRRLMNMGRMGQTNDRGEYRIWGLGVGDYYVSAAVNERPMFIEAASDSGSVGSEPASLAPTYYPGTAVVDEAQRVAVAAGQEVTGVDFTLVTTRTVRVSGTAFGSDGKPMASAMVMAMPRNMMEGAVMMPQGAQTDAGGNFTLPGVAPGEYILQARPNFAMGGDTQENEVAFTPLSVAGMEDIRNVMIVGSRGVKVSGRIIFEGTPPAGASDAMNVMLGPVPGETMFPMGRPSNARVTPERTFVVRGVTGRRTVHVMGLPAAWVVKSARIGGQDILETGYDFAREDVSNVEVVVSSTTTTIAGKVTGRQNETMTDCFVLAFPTDEEHWQPFSRRRFSVARPDQNGVYQVRHLPEGSYYVLAVEAMPEEWGNPDVFKVLKEHARRVTLQDGGTESLDLVLPQAK